VVEIVARHVRVRRVRRRSEHLGSRQARHASSSPIDLTSGRREPRAFDASTSRGSSTTVAWDIDRSLRVLLAPPGTCDEGRGRPTAALGGAAWLRRSRESARS
jgi:hypothetical protein